MPVVLEWPTETPTAPRRGSRAHRSTRHTTTELRVHRAGHRHSAPRAPSDRLGSPFWGLWTARTVSSLGDGLTLVALPILATRLTHSALLIAGVAVAAGLPWLLVALPAGAIADRVDRRRLVGVTEITRMVVLAALGALILTGSATIASLYLCALALAACETAFMSATQAVLPDLVDERHLAKANGRLMVSEATCAQFVGPALAGLLFAASASLPFLADGVTFAGSAVILLSTLPRRQLARTIPAGRALPKTSIRADVAEGVRWFAGNSVLRLVGALIASFAFCQAMGLAILVIFALRVLHLTGTEFGFFMAAAAIGNILGGLVAAKALDRFGPGRILVLAGLLAAAGFVLVAAATTVPLALTGLILEAIAVGVGNVASITVRQSIIPSELAGRVNSAMRTCTFGAATVGALAGGVLVTVGGSRLPFAFGGAMQAVAALAIGIPLARLLAAKDDIVDVRDFVDDDAALSAALSVREAVDLALVQVPADVA